MRACILLLALLVPGTAMGQGIRFRDVTKDAKLFEPLVGIMGHGAAWGDVDGDGRPDLFVGGFGDRPNKEYGDAKGPVAAKLFRNKGDGTFEAIKNPAVEMFARTSGAVFADLDNNGTLELYVANNARKAAGKKTEEPQRTAVVTGSKLFRNDAGILRDISKESGSCPESLLSARNIGVFDYDGDGLLDLLLIEDKFTA